MKAKRIYQFEKRFAEAMAMMSRDDPFIRQLPSNKYIITLPHPIDDTEYVLSTWENRNEPREFVDLGRCVNCALKMGAASIHFKLLSQPEQQG